MGVDVKTLSIAKSNAKKVVNDILTSGSGGITVDLSAYTTDNLAESATKKYMTPQEKIGLADAISKAHIHTNESNLDLLSDDGTGNLTYNGAPVGVTGDAQIVVNKLTTGGTGLKYLNDQGDYVAITTTFEIDEWVSGVPYAAGVYIIYNNRLFKSKVATSNTIFDVTEWESLSGSVYCPLLTNRPSIGKEGILYIIGKDSSNGNDSTIYIWDSSMNDYKSISGGGTAAVDNKQVLVSTTDANAGFLGDKIIGTTGKVNLTLINPGTNEQIQVNLDSNIFDKSIDTADNITAGISNKFYTTDLAKDDIGSSLLDTTTIDFTYDSTAKTIKADVKTNTSIQKIEVGKNGGLRGTRKQVNFIEGANSSITINDDATNDKLDVIIASTAETNTASNTGSTGVGIFNKKDVYDLQFKKLDSANNKLLIQDDSVNGIVKFTIDDSKLTISGSQIPDLSTAIANDGNVTQLLLDEHTHSNYTVLSNIDDVGGKLTYNGHDIGDVIMSSIDSNLDGIVDKAATLDGLIATIAELNYTKGLTGNIQDKFNALGSGVQYGGTKATHADMIAMTSPAGGTFIIVLADETQGGGRSQYIYNATTSSWEYNGTFGGTVRDFTTNPINVVTESTGVISEPRIDTLIARKTDLPTIANKSVLDQISDISGDLCYKGSPIVSLGNLLDDSVVVTTKTWSSNKINSMAGNVGVKSVAEANRGDKKLLIYDSVSDKMVYTHMFVPDWLQAYSYEKGNIVWYDGQMYRCKVAHTSGILFTDDVDLYWTQVSGGGGSGGVAALKEVSGQVNIAANDSVYLHLNVGFNKYDLRTLYAKSLQDNNLVIEIYNKTNSGFMVYQSLEQAEIHDILMTPCEDLDATKCIHVKIFNNGSTATDVNYLFYITSLA